MIVCLCEQSVTRKSHDANPNIIVSFCFCRQIPDTRYPTNLHHPQVLQSLLEQFLDLPVLRLILVLTESIPRPPAGIFTEVEGGELRRLTEEGAELL